MGACPPTVESSRSARSSQETTMSAREVVLCNPVRTAIGTYGGSLKNTPPSGIQIACQVERSQHGNRERAMTMLRTKLYESELQKKNEAESKRRKTMVSTGDRSAKIRTYNYPQSRVTDHRIGMTLYNLPAFMNGDIQGMIDALQVAENAERLKEGAV